MFKWIKYLLLLFTIFVLIGCQLAVNTSSNTTSTISSKYDKPYALQIKLDEDTIDYYLITLFHDFTEEDLLSSSNFIKDIHISIIYSDQEHITATYLFDRDRYECITLSYLFLNDNKEIIEGPEETFCEDQAYLTYNSSTYLHTVTLTLKDVDYLDNIEIVEYDNEFNKLRSNTLELSQKEISYVISKDTDKFLIIQKYIDAHGEVYYLREHFNRSSIEKDYFDYFYYTVVSLNQTNERQLSIIKFTIEDEDI